MPTINPFNNPARLPDKTMPQTTQQKDWVILKFGGSSVGEAKHWQTILNQVQINLSKGLRPLLVLSALKHVSNLLEALLHQSLAGVHPIAIEHLKEQHLNFAAQLGLNISDQLTPWFEQLSLDCQQIHQTNQITAKLHARILSVGELLSSTIGAHYLQQQLNKQSNLEPESGSASENIECHWQDARQLLTATTKTAEVNDLWHHYTSTECSYQFNPGLCAQLISLSKSSLSVIVTQGFIASDKHNDTVLLGREGSDTSAAYFGALLNAKEIQIWTDVPGVFSTNPQQNNQAKQLKHLSYSEAKQMAQFGAKVLHPRALQPASENAIPLLVKSTHHAAATGTLVDATTSLSPAVKAIVETSQVICFAQAINAEQQTSENSGLKRLLSLGYDIVLKEINQAEKLPSLYFVLRYNNSDKMELALNSLNKIIASNENEQPLVHSLQNKLSLISIIGVANQHQWQQKVKAFCLQQSQLTHLQLFINPGDGRVSLLVAEEQSQKWLQRLHQELIEDNNSTEFGENWLTFVEPINNIS